MDEHLGLLEEVCQFLYDYGIPSKIDHQQRFDVGKGRVVTTNFLTVWFGNRESNHYGRGTLSIHNGYFKMSEFKVPLASPNSLDQLVAYIKNGCR